MALDHRTKMKSLYLFMGTITGVHKNLDALRDKHKMVGGYPSDADYNIEMAQQSLEVAMMRLQQVVALSDPEVCTTSTPPCSDEGGPCPKHTETP